VFRACACPAPHTRPGTVLLTSFQPLPAFSATPSRRTRLPLACMPACSGTTHASKLLVAAATSAPTTAREKARPPRPAPQRMRFRRRRRGAALHLRLEEDDGVGVADGRKQQPLGLARAAGHHHLDARHVREDRLGRLRVVVPAMADRACTGGLSFLLCSGRQLRRGQERTRGGEKCCSDAPLPRTAPARQHALCRRAHTAILPDQESCRCCCADSAHARVELLGQQLAGVPG